MPASREAAGEPSGGKHPHLGAIPRSGAAPSDGILLNNPLCKSYLLSFSSQASRWRSWRMMLKMMTSRPQPPKVKLIKLYVEESGVGPPQEPTVDYDPKPVLWLPDGKPLKRKVGF